MESWREPTIVLKPPNDITASEDGDVLVLTTMLRENGAPIWA